MNVNTQAIQQYVRIALYYLFGALGTYGISVPDDRRAMIVSIAGTLATLAWTVYGTRLNGLLEFAKQKAGVNAIEVHVDPKIITPADVTTNTSLGITAKVP
jgi:hypothetical protein